MRRYETIFLSHPDLTEEALEKLTKKKTDLIKKAKGEVFQVEQWGKRRLAYTVKRNLHAYYTLLDYAALSDVIKELERVLRLDDQVLKYLTVKLADKVDLEAVRKDVEDKKKAAAPLPVEPLEAESAEVSELQPVTKPEAPEEKEEVAETEARPVAEEKVPQEEAAESEAQPSPSEEVAGDIQPSPEEPGKAEEVKEPSSKKKAKGKIVQPEAEVIEESEEEPAGEDREEDKAEQKPKREKKATKAKKTEKEKKDTTVRAKKKASKKG